MKIKTIISYIFAMLLHVSPIYAQTWQSALGMSGVLNSGEFPVCDFRLNIVTLSTSTSAATAQSPTFRIYNLTHLRGTISSSSSGSTAIPPHLAAVLSPEDIQVLQPFAGSARLSFGGGASLVIRQPSNTSTGFIAQYMANTTPGSTSGQTVTLNGNSQGTFLLEKRCTASSNVGSPMVISGSGMNSLVQVPGTNQFHWRLGVGFQFPYVSQFDGPISRVVVSIPSIGYVGSASFNRSTTFAMFESSGGGMNQIYGNLSRQQSATGVGGWTANISANFMNPQTTAGLTVTHPVFVSIISATPEGERTVGTTSIAAPYQR